MTHITSFPELVAVPIRTAAGVRHVTGQAIDEAGLLAVHPELTDAGFTGRWAITNVLTGFTIDFHPEAAVWPDRRALTTHRAGGVL